MESTKSTSIMPPRVKPAFADPNSALLLEAIEKMLDSRFAKMESRLSLIENRIKEIPPKKSIIKTIGPINLSKTKCDSADKSANVIKGKPTQSSQVSSDNLVEEDLLCIKTEIVDSLSSFDNKMSEFSLVLEKQEESLNNIRKRIENAVPQEEIRNLVPKIVQLQTNLDLLLAGESETNALMDNVIPTINKLQKDVEECTGSQKKESEKLNKELFPKIQKSLDELGEKTRDIKGQIYGDTQQILDKNIKILKSVQDVKNKMIEDKILTSSSSGQCHYQSSSSTRQNMNYHPEGPNMNPYNISFSSEALNLSNDLNVSKEIYSQLLMLARGIEHLEKEIKKVDAIDLLEQIVIPNINSIQKSIIQLVPPHQSVPQSSTSNKKVDPVGRNYYGKYSDEICLRKRIIAENYRNSKTRGGSSDEHGKRPSDGDESYRSKSPQRSHSSRSRSHDSDCGDRSKERRKKTVYESSSPDSDDGDIQVMERQIEKISNTVVEIQDKMESWMKCFKKTLAKSDENTGSLMEKLSNTSSTMEAMNAKMESLSQSLDKSIDKKGTHTGNAIKIISATDRIRQEKCMYDFESKFSEFSSSFERHFSEISSKIDYAFVKSASKSDEVITTTLLHRLDDLINRTKKSESYIKSNNENTAKIFSLLKKIESAEKAIFCELQKNLSSMASEESSLNEISKRLETVSPRLNDLCGNVLPALDEIKNMQKRLNEKNDLEKKEDFEYLRKILSLLEDIKENKKAESSSDNNNLIQIFNALNDLKITMNSKETNTSKILNELKTDNSKLFGRINETIKTSKSFEKLTHKVTSILEELRKNNTTDAKTISQMNTLLQGIKASGPAYENKVLNSLKDLRDHLMVRVTKLPTMDNLASLLKSKSDNDTDFSIQFQSIKKLIEELIDKVNLDESQNLQQLLDSTQTIILEMFSKELKEAEKNILQIGTSLEGHLEKNEVHKAKVLAKMDEGLKFRIDKLENYLGNQFKDVDQKIQEFSDVFSSINVVPNKKYNKKNDVSSFSIDLSAKLSSIEKKMLSEKEFNTMMDELSKYKKLGSEILNSVEDLKILTSSTPTAIHEIVPKIEKIHSIILDIPNEFLTAMAATEENLCVNLDVKIKDQHQLTLQEILDKFDHMDNRMAVIKKYAKHGPSVNSSALSAQVSSIQVSSAPSQSSSNEEQSKQQTKPLQNVEPNLGCVARQMNEMKSVLIEELSCVKDFKSSFESFQSSIIPIVEDVRTLDKQIYREQAKGLVVEDQLEALCNTLLQPIQKLGCGEELIASHNSETIFTSLLNSMEDKQIQCLELLSDLISSLRGSNHGSAAKDSLSDAVKTAVEVAICPMDLGGEGNVNGDRTFPLDNESKQRVECINKLVAYFKKVQDLETDIISKCDRSIELQTQLNEHLNSVVPNVDRVRSLLEGLASPVRDASYKDKSFDALDNLCEDIVRHLKEITELSQRSSEPRSKSIDELKEFVQSSVSVMERLFKEDENEKARNSNDLVLHGSSKLVTPSLNDDDPNVMDSDFGDIKLNTATITVSTASQDPPSQTVKENDPVPHCSATVPSVQSPESLPETDTEVPSKSRKRKVGPKSCVPDYVDQGALVQEEEEEGDGETVLRAEESDSAFSCVDQSLQPVVKLFKPKEKPDPHPSKRSKVNLAIEPPELIVLPPSFSLAKKPPENSPMSESDSANRQKQDDAQTVVSTKLPNAVSPVQNTSK